MDKKRHIFKILFAGECSVGKSSLILRYLNSEFLESSKTIGVDFFTKMINIDEESFTICIWDTSGHQIYRDLISKCYDFSDLVYIVFDISQRTSFLNASNWIQSVRSKLGERAKIILVGNKCDLNREIEKEEAENFASEQGIQYIETSAKNNSCVDEMFSFFLDQFCGSQKNEELCQNENQEKQQNNSNCIIE